MLLIDTYNFKPTLIESEEGKTPRFEGVGQRCDVKNQNNRIYPRTLWEKLRGDPRVKERLEARQAVGQLSHPKGEADPEKISHVITDFWIGEGGDVFVKGEIAPTPAGKLLESLLKFNVTLGISSRGSGSLKRVNDTDIVQEDYVLDTWDWVLNPSTQKAYPKLTEETENEENKGEKLMLATEKFQLLEQRAFRLLSVKKETLTENVKDVVDPVMSDLIIELTKLQNESPDLKGLTENLINKLNAKRNEIRLVEEFGKKEKEDEDEDEDDEKKDVKEATTGSADTGFRRTMDFEPPPGPGEGWPIDPSDAGVLAGINDGINDFMKKGGSVVEEFLGEESEENTEEEALESALKRVAVSVVQLPETEYNSVARAFAGAYLMENGLRKAETSSYARIVDKLQEKFTQANEKGVILIDGANPELVEKYETVLKAFDELTERHRLLSAKVYAEHKLEEIGLKNDASAKKKLSEVIRNANSKELKSSIDEAITMLMTAVKGFKKPEKETISESKEEATKLEEKVANLNETNKKVDASLELGKKLSEALSFSVPRVRA